MSMETIGIIMNAITEPKVIASLFAISALLLAVPLIVRGTAQFATQLLGSILVVAICFSAHNVIVYTISVFVIATLVTELHFLEKIAALIWNRKEYWDYLSGSATEDEVKGKAESEVAAEILNENIDEPDDVEQIEDVASQPEGILEIEAEKPHFSKNELVLNALRLEKDVFESLKNKIPFSYDSLKNEVRISSGARKHLIDIVIETKNVHYLIEVKNYRQASSLVDAVRQLDSYSEAYKGYLRERKIKAAVQPLIVVPDSLNSPKSIRGVPIVSFNENTKEFSNFKSEYASYEIEPTGNLSSQSLRSLLIQFLRSHSKWAFSPLRIQKWGSKQTGYEKLAIFTTNDIRRELEALLAENVLVESTSKKGNRLFRIKL
ncbi:nuclease-related domain-containing protein [Alteromonas macleodii]|uniref:nuclease-related domain-containing protein n=1 Tax=Alteromonas macleodii TaxID=28108 RepID=UPI002076BC2E|nr:nuclease-related domain-containing protein [Alteromonas macleodii]USI27891.1 NERD domain-containing protein [Alteromonas macleodii]